MSDAEQRVEERRVETVSNDTLSSEEHGRDGLAKALEMKDEGNKFFVEKNWTSAITAYTQALSYLPSPPVVRKAGSTSAESSNQEQHDGKQDDKTDEEIEHGVEEGTISSADQDTPSQEATAATPLMKECSTIRVALNSNIAACEIKLVRKDAPLMPLYIHYACRKHGQRPFQQQQLPSTRILTTKRHYGEERKPTRRWIRGHR